MALRLGGGTTPRGERGDAKDADRPAQRQGDHLPGAHVLGAFEHALAVDADVPVMNQCLRAGAALDQPNAVEEAIYAQCFSA